MQNMASESSQKKKNILPIIGGVVILALIVVIILLSVGQKEQSLAYESTLSSITQVANTLTADAASVQEVSTATPTEVIQEATATVVVATDVPDTATPMIAADNQDLVSIKYVCMDNDYDYSITDNTAFDGDSLSYRESEISGNDISANIPVLSCMVEVEFEQPITEDIKVSLYQNRDPLPWYQKTLINIEGKTNTYYAILNHQYVISPPYWDLQYGMKIEGSETIYWDGTLSLSRSFSGLCWEGSMPDPVTLECPYTDVLEREPHPDMPTLVPDGLPK